MSCRINLPSTVALQDPYKHERRKEREREREKDDDDDDEEERKGNYPHW